MSYTYGYVATLHKLRAEVSDTQYGNPLRVFDDHEATGVAFWRGTADVTPDHYLIAHGAATILWPLGPIAPDIGDEVSADGQRWRVNGWASTLTSVFTGRTPGILVSLEAVE